MKTFKLHFKRPIGEKWITKRAYSLRQAEMLGRLKAQQAHCYGWDFIEAVEV